MIIVKRINAFINKRSKAGKDDQRVKITRENDRGII